MASVPVETAKKVLVSFYIDYYALLKVSNVQYSLYYVSLIEIHVVIPNLRAALAGIRD